MKRPILYWVILFILGEVLYKIVSIYMVSILGILFLIGVIKKRRPGRKWVLQLVGVACFFLGIFCIHTWSVQIAKCEALEGKTVRFSGTVIQKQETAYTLYYVVKTGKVNGEKCSIKIRICLKEGETVSLGNSMEGVGVAKAFSTATNPGGYDDKTYRQGNGILMSVEEVEILQEYVKQFSIRRFLDGVQMALSNTYESLFEEKNASLAIAMLLGDKKNLDADVKELYQRNGIAHLIAISGLHIAMLGGTLYQFLRKRTGNYGFSALAGVVFIVAYGVMTGLSGSALRAIIMLSVSLGADVTGRRYDGLNGIAFALFLMLIGNPYQITQVGFLLSFGAVLGIIQIQPIWKLWFPKLPRIANGFFVSVSVQLILNPIMLSCFYEIPMYSIALNVFVVPITNGLLALLLLCGILGSVSLKLAAVPAWIAEWIFKINEGLCELFETFPFHTLCTGKPDFWWLLLYYGVLILFVWLALQRRKKESVLALSLLFLLFGSFLLPKSVWICMYDVGQGDSIYIRTKYQQHILVDGGSSTKRQVGKYVLENGLKYYGAGRLDYVFVTHIDSDHYNGIAEILTEEMVQIQCLVLPAIQNPDEAYRELEILALQRGCKIYYMKKGDVLQIDGVQFICLNPLQQEYTDKNAGSIVLQMQYENFDMLLTGDLAVEGEQAILSDITEPIEILKVAHHGSNTSSSERFLERLRPAVACVSVGENNIYGHPAPEVMERLSRYAKKIYLTKESGAITIETDGNQYQVETWTK